MLEDAILKVVGVSGVGGLIVLATRGVYRAYREGYREPRSIVYHRDSSDDEENKKYEPHSDNHK
jgi:hypothetical protein